MSATIRRTSRFKSLIQSLRDSLPEPPEEVRRAEVGAVLVRTLLFGV